MRILPQMRKQFTVLAAATLALTGAATLSAVTPSGAAVHRAPVSRARAGSTVDGLVVYVGYAENKSGNAPKAGAFPSTWSGASGVTFLGNPIPGSQSGCGTLKCWDAGAIMLKNTKTTAVTVSKVDVNVHGSIKGGKIYLNLWGSFTVQPGKSVILTENPPANNPSYDNFDTSGDPTACTPIKVAPYVRITIGGTTTKLTDSTHVLDTGGVDPGSCPNGHNESIPWRRIGTGTVPFSASPRVTVSCPAPWTCLDIGNPLPVGSQSYSTTKKLWTINAGGTDITGLSDQFHYVYEKFAGNVSAIVHVLTQTDTSPGAKAGLMFRATKDPGSPNYALLVSPGEGIKVQVRKVQGGDTQKLANPPGTTPAWLKITRSGNTYTAYTSTDGSTWKLIPGSTITLVLTTGRLRVGLAVTSHHPGVSCTVTMSGVKLG